MSKVYMRILFVITSLRTGGAERLVAEMIPEMVRQGHHVDLYLFDGTETPLLKNLRAKEVKVLTFSKGVGHMWNPLHVLKLRKILKDGNYDIVHTHNSPAQILTALAAGKRTSVKLVTTEHNTFTKRRRIIFLRWIDPLFYKAYTHIICVSPTIQSKLIEYVNIDPCKISIIPNGINLVQFSQENIHRPQNLPPQNPEDKIILMTAAFRKQKDQPTLIKAMQYLPSNYKLWLAGGWKRKRKAEKLARKLNLKERVCFLGERRDIPYLMQLADVNVLATHYEGMPLAAIEAMASGKPFIASDVSGVTDVASGAAWLVPESNPTALADAIHNVIENPEVSDKITQNCIHRASQYDIKNTIRAHISLYGKLCK